MPDADFFAKLGLFIARDFLDAKLCAEMRAESRASMHLPAVVADGDYAEGRRVESVRRTTEAMVSAATQEAVREKLLAVKPQLETHFQVTLENCERPQFLLYRAGDFFLPHRDSDAAAEEHDYIRRRRVSIIVFLNDGTAKGGAEPYEGGLLTFYGLFDDPRWEKYGFPFSAEVGLLAAFRSHIYHEVTPVSRGERYTIASWFS